MFHWKIPGFIKHHLLVWILDWLCTKKKTVKTTFKIICPFISLFTASTTWTLARLMNEWTKYQKFLGILKVMTAFQLLKIPQISGCGKKKILKVSSYKKMNYFEKHFRMMMMIQIRRARTQEPWICYRFINCWLTY